MKTSTHLVLIAAVAIFLAAAPPAAPPAAPAADPAADPAERERCLKLQADGNFKEAYEGFRKLALDPAADPRKVGEDLHRAVECLTRLNRVAEIDAFREAVVAAHGESWRVLWAAARSYLDVQHQGFIVAGEFVRGPKRGGGQYVSALERDRVRALQIAARAIPGALAEARGDAAPTDQAPADHSRTDAARTDAADFLLDVSDMLLNRRVEEAWRLQYLSDLAELPDYEPGWGSPRTQTGAPVDAEGNPVFHGVPESFEAASTDGERWRWCLQEAMEMSPARKATARLRFARFLWSQFGVQTMAELGWRFGRLQTDDTRDRAGGGKGGSSDKEDGAGATEDAAAGTFALHTLSESETIARLAGGVRRLKLPDEFNFLKIYADVAETATGGPDIEALEMLATIHENRRQYPKAAETWRSLIARHGERPHWKERLEQIVGSWGSFEVVASQPAGRGATVEYRFRNGRAVELAAKRIDVPKLLEDIKAYLKTRPQNVDWRKVNVENIGYRLVTEKETRYLGEEVARWKLDLDPRTGHMDRRLTVTTPLEKPGAYFLTASIPGGNTSHIILWVDDTVIARKPLAGKALYYVADAVTGAPVPRANLEFFGYRVRWRGGNRREVEVKQFAELTGPDGIAVPDPGDHPADFQWLVTARTQGEPTGGARTGDGRTGDGRTGEGRFGHLGFAGVWYQPMPRASYDQTKVFVITDRPVYRPAQTVKYKLWVRHVRYEDDGADDFAGKSFTVEIQGPKGDKVREDTRAADDRGGVEGELALAGDAALGAYRILVRRTETPASWMGGGSFLVEEYKKPEFEVTVEAPAEPILLGEKVEATIRARYYFGAPVTQARVKYKVLRTPREERWYPPMPWDWLYGRGYWWFSPDYDWYPGFAGWGCRRPWPVWWSRGAEPPEVVAEGELPIGPEGTVKVEIDTALAKLLHPDRDHSYSITAEVVDASRRTIVGAGRVIVARKPFEVAVWVDRGHYRVGDTIRASVAARTPDGKPVAAAGEIALLAIRYDDGKPVETTVRTWKVETGPEGSAVQQITASRAGQYRLSAKLVDAAGREIEGGYILLVRGEGFDASGYRFAHLELVPDRREYAPGEKVQLQVGTDREGSTVLLFVRAEGGVVPAPEVIRMRGKAAMREIAVERRDMPNFFVEALTVSDGRVHTEVREIFVPPEKRVLSVKVEPSSGTYRPGENASVKLRLEDLSGEPFPGSAVVAIYDKSVEYIAGGSNVPEIREFFWKWRRRHFPRTETSLRAWSHNLVPDGQRAMAAIGVFGATVADDLDAGMDPGAAREGGLGGGPGRGGGGLGGTRTAGAAPGAAMDRALSLGANAAPMAEAAKGEMADGAGGGGGPAGPGGGPGEAAEVEPAVRKEFADTALWVASLPVDASGAAEVELAMPESLTTWRIRVWALGAGTRVGEGAVEVITRKDLILRLQAPRFFVERDEVVLSANIHNYLGSAKDVRAVLELEGGTLEPLDDPARAVRVEPEGEARVDWKVRVVGEGEAVVRMKALTDEESDAMEMRFPAYVHGMEKVESWSGAIRPDGDAGKIVVRVPAERRPEASRLEVRYSPSLAGAMVDALPYLVSYPYGCTEQTLNRFLPTVIVQKILLDMGLDLGAIREKRANLNAQEIGDDRERAKGWKRFAENPVFDPAEVGRMVKTGVRMLTEMQLSDGGWGWFSGWGERSSPHTTATVVHGLQTAARNDVALVPGVLERGVEWLARHQAGEVQKLANALQDPKVRPWKDRADNTDALVYRVLQDAGVKEPKMRDFLYRDRTHLTLYGLALLGLALEKGGDGPELAMVLRNLGQYVTQDDENQTAWLDMRGGPWWYWYGSEIEAQAAYLALLARTEAKGELASRLVKYLLTNRKHASYWSSTRDTALAIEAMADYLRASDEGKPEMTVQVLVDGRMEKAVEITAANLFTFDNKLVLEGPEVSTGEHTIELRKDGKGPLYYNAYLTNFTLEETIAKAGLEVRVERKYYRLERVDAAVHVAGSRGQAVEQKVEKYRRVALEDFATVSSGDLVEVELEIESKNDYEYLVFEDMKPAGFEPVDLRSGYTGNALGAYVEFRDERVAMFVRWLARGRHSASYRMRAEIPGKFSALPTKAWAMYAPELRGNSDEIRLRVEDRE